MCGLTFSQKVLATVATIYYLNVVWFFGFFFFF